MRRSLCGCVQRLPSARYPPALHPHESTLEAFRQSEMCQVRSCDAVIFMLECCDRRGNRMSANAAVVEAACFCGEETAINRHFLARRVVSYSGLVT